MSFSASSYGRVSNLMSSQIALTNLNRTNAELFRVNQQLSTGLDINVASDDPIRAAGISALDSSLERSSKQLANLQLAISALDLADTTLGDAIDQLSEAMDIGSAQLSFGASADERSAQSVVIQSILDGLNNLGNTIGQGIGATNTYHLPQNHPPSCTPSQKNTLVLPNTTSTRACLELRSRTGTTQHLYPPHHPKKTPFHPTAK